jgi:5'-nucleotidase
LAEAHAPAIIRQALAAGWPRDVILNLNFPYSHEGEAPSVEVTRQGFRGEVALHFERRQDLRGRDYYWTGFSAHSGQPEPGTDICAVAEGRISVTPLHIDLTHEGALGALKTVFG